MQKARLQFKSQNSFYLVDCEDDDKKEIESYVNIVENLIPSLKEVFGLEPSYAQLKIIFGKDGPHYESGGIIKLQNSMRFVDPENIYGGLFHETIHGFLEKYIHRPKGPNHFPESCAIIMQVAALDKINKEWADKFASGIGSTPDNHAVLFELVRIYRSAGFKPIRKIYTMMGTSEYPVLRKDTFINDLNKILEQAGEKINL